MRRKPRKILVRMIKTKDLKASPEVNQRMRRAKMKPITMARRKRRIRARSPRKERKRSLRRLVPQALALFNNQITQLKLTLLLRLTHQPLATTQKIPRLLQLNQSRLKQKPTLPRMT